MVTAAILDFRLFLETPKSQKVIGEFFFFQFVTTKIREVCLRIIRAIFLDIEWKILEKITPWNLIALLHFWSYGERFWKKDKSNWKKKGSERLYFILS